MEEGEGWIDLVVEVSVGVEESQDEVDGGWTTEEFVCAVFMLLRGWCM
jgi:hypothetical protein